MKRYSFAQKNEINSFNNRKLAYRVLAAIRLTVGVSTVQETTYGVWQLSFQQIILHQREWPAGFWNCHFIWHFQCDDTISQPYKYILTYPIITYTFFVGNVFNFSKYIARYLAPASDHERAIDYIVVSTFFWRRTNRDILFV